MAVQYESDGGTVFAASNSNAAITVPLPATRPTGSALILIAWSRLITDTVGTAPSGYTLLTGYPKASTTAAGGRLWVYGRVATSSETAPTIAMSGAVTGNSGDLWGACIFCYSGVDTSGTIDDMFEAFQAFNLRSNLDDLPVIGVGTSPPPAATSMTLQFLARFRDAVDTFTPTATWTEREDAGSTVRTGAQFFLQDKIAGTGSNQVTPSVTFSSRYLSLTLVIKQASTGTAWTQPVDDTLSLDDSATIESGKTASIPDTLALADALTSQADFARAVPDTLALADAQTVARDIAQAIIDSLSLADATALVRAIAQAVDDTLALADSATTAAGKGAQIDDTLPVADALRFDQTLAVADTVALTDVVAQAEEIHISDTLALSDLCDPVKTTGGVALTQPVADTVGLADALTFDRAQTIPDTLAVADTLTSQAALLRTLADTVAMADSLTYQAALLRAVTDTLALTDLCDPVKSTGAVDWAQPITDTVAIADAVTAAFDRGLTVTDTLALADAANTTSSILRTIADTLALVDALTTTGSGAQTVADTVTVTDQVRLDRTLVLADVVAVADQLVTQAALARSIADTLALADSIVAQRGRLVALADTLAVTDTLVFAFERQLAFADTVSLDDLLTSQAALQRLIADMVFVADELFSDSVIPLPLPPGELGTATGGYIYPNAGQSGGFYTTQEGELAVGITGVLARTGG